MSRISAFRPTVLPVGQEIPKGMQYCGSVVAYDDAKEEARVDFGGNNYAALKTNRIFQVTSDGGKPWISEDADTEFQITVGVELICLLQQADDRSLRVYKACSRDKFDQADQAIWDRKVAEHTGSIVQANEHGNMMLRKATIALLPKGQLLGIVEFPHITDPNVTLRATFERKMLVNVTCDETSRLFLTDDRAEEAATRLQIGDKVMARVVKSESGHVMCLKMALLTDCELARESARQLKDAPATAAQPLTGYRVWRNVPVVKPAPRPEEQLPKRPIIQIVPEPLVGYKTGRNTGPRTKGLRPSDVEQVDRAQQSIANTGEAAEA